MTSNYKVAIKQSNALFYLSYSIVMYKFYITRVESRAELFPDSVSCIQALNSFLAKTFKGNANNVPIVIIKNTLCPLVKTEPIKDTYDPFEYFDINDIG